MYSKSGLACVSTGTTASSSVFIYTYMRMHYVYIYIYVYTHTYACMHVYNCFVCVYIHVCTFVHIAASSGEASLQELLELYKAPPPTLMHVFCRAGGGVGSKLKFRTWGLRFGVLRLRPRLSQGLLLQGLRHRSRFEVVVTASPIKRLKAMSSP